MRFSLSMACVTAMAAVGGAVQMATANNGSAYSSGLVNAGGYFYESFGNFAGNGSGGVLSQTVTTNADARATYFSYGSAGFSLGASGLTSLSASVSVTGDELQRVTGKQDAGYLMGDSLTTSTSGVSLAWYVMYQDAGGSLNIWLSNAANRIDLNAVRAGGTTAFGVSLDAANFESFPAWPQGGASFGDALANAQYFGLLVTTSTASGADFAGMAFDQWINSTPGTAWNPYAVQRNGNYGAFSTGTSAITVSNVVPAPGAFALLGAAGLLGSRRRR
jgi:hypothetical protein